MPSHLSLRRSRPARAATRRGARRLAARRVVSFAGARSTDDEEDAFPVATRVTSDSEDEKFDMLAPGISASGYQPPVSCALWTVTRSFPFDTPSRLPRADRSGKQDLWYESPARWYRVHRSERRDVVQPYSIGKDGPADNPLLFDRFP